jgi:hypothetical protein
MTRFLQTDKDTEEFIAKATSFVIPAQAGIHEAFIKPLDSGSSPE